MNPSRANLINSTILFFMGLWGYFDVSSVTALIPSIFGVLIFICYLVSLKNPKLNKLFAHISVTLTFLILFVLIGTRLPKSLEDGGIGLFRLALMIISSGFAVIIFVKSFIDARRKS